MMKPEIEESQSEETSVHRDAVFPSIICPEHGLEVKQFHEDLLCGPEHRFEKRGGIPRILSTPSEYVDAFGAQWNKYRLTQLDSYTRSTITRDRLKRCIGDELWDRLNGESPIQVLETGCGAGRFTEILLQQPAVVLTSTDLSSAVDANQVNCPQSERHRVIQCDINAMPFARESYDVVVCLGVVQHTPDVDRTISALYDQVKPGGWLIIDHYTPSVSHYTKFTALALRPILKRLPPRQGMLATEWLTNLFFPLHRAVKRHRWMQMLLSRVSPLLTYFQAYPQLDDRLHYEWALLDTHDTLTDYYKHLRTVPQIRASLAQLGAENIWVSKGGNGVEARCRKPMNR